MNNPTSTLEPPSLEETVTETPLPKDEWPTATTTWLRYCYIGRWNYAKGIGVAAVLGAIGAAFLGWQFFAFALAVAVTYVCVSCAGLRLLYGTPSERIFRRLLEMAGTNGDERVLDIHFGTYRASRVLLDLLPQATVFGLGVHDPEHESEPAVLDVWKFERPPVSHPRFEEVEGDASSFDVSDGGIDLVVLGFGIHELHSAEEKTQLVREIHRVLSPNGKVVLFERGHSPWLALVFGPLFLHFTPAKEWDAWLRNHFDEVDRLLVFGMVDLFSASSPRD